MMVKCHTVSKMYCFDGKVKCSLLPLTDSPLNLVPGADHTLTDSPHILFLNRMDFQSVHCSFSSYNSCKFFKMEEGLVCCTRIFRNILSRENIDIATSCYFSCYFSTMDNICQFLILHLHHDILSKK